MHFVSCPEGCEPDHEFNLLHGVQRLIFRHPTDERHIDMFLDRFQMYHTFDLRKRLILHPVTLTRTFTRKATGLVRQAGIFDVLVYNVNFISVGLMVALMALIIPSYAGGNISLSLLFCALLALPTACVYAFLSAAMPRSGSDYVYVSRVLGPAAGMMGSWN